MKFIQCVLLIMLAVGLRAANAEAPKAQCPKLKASNWVNTPNEKAASDYLRLWDGPKGQEVFQPVAPKATK